MILGPMNCSAIAEHLDDRRNVRPPGAGTIHPDQDELFWRSTGTVGTAARKPTTRDRCATRDAPRTARRAGTLWRFRSDRAGFSSSPPFALRPIELPPHDPFDPSCITPPSPLPKASHF